MLTTILYIILAILATTTLFIAVRTYLFERSRGAVEKIDGLAVDSQQVAEHLAAAVRCQTVPLDETGTPDPEEFYDPSQYGPDLSRGFQGLRVWLPVKLFGAARFKAALAEKRALAVEAADRIGRLRGVVMAAPPQLSLFAFYLTWPGASREDENAATRNLLERVTVRGRVMLTGCTVDGRALARVCVLSFRTRRPQIEACVEDVAAEVAALL